MRGTGGWQAAGVRRGDAEKLGSHIMCSPAGRASHVRAAIAHSRSPLISRPCCWWRWLRGTPCPPPASWRTLAGSQRCSHDHRPRTARPPPAAAAQGGPAVALAWRPWSMRCLRPAQAQSRTVVLSSANGRVSVRSDARRQGRCAIISWRSTVCSLAAAGRRRCQAAASCPRPSPRAGDPRLPMDSRHTCWHSRGPGTRGAPTLAHLCMAWPKRQAPPPCTFAYGCPCNAGREDKKITNDSLDDGRQGQVP